MVEGVLPSKECIVKRPGTVLVDERYSGSQTKSQQDSPQDTGHTEGWQEIFVRGGLKE